MGGVSSDFFCESIRLLSKIHGQRYVGHQANLDGLLRTLGEVEAVWQAMPAAPERIEAPAEEGEKHGETPT